MNAELMQQVLQELGAKEMKLSLVEMTPNR
jgi:hypothetical protein